MIPTWAERCEKFGDEIVTNAKIQQMMQEEIDELRSKIDKMLDDTVSLTDDLFSERKEVIKLETEIKQLRKVVEDTIGQAFYEDDYRKAQAEIEVLKNKYEFLSGHAQQSDIMINELRQELALQRLSDIGQEIEHAMICTKCNNTEWVCENHPDKEAHKCCGGAGMPCECTKESE